MSGRDTWLVLALVLVNVCGNCHSDCYWFVVLRGLALRLSILSSSFDAYDVFQHKEEGPISEPVLLHLSSTGQVLHKMGANT